MNAVKWLTQATRLIRFAPDKNRVWRELSDHIEDRRADLLAHFPDLSPEEAEARAVETMGDPEPVARELGRLHRPWLGYLWRLSQALMALAAAVLLAALVYNLVSDSADGLAPCIRELVTWDASEHFPDRDENILSRRVYRPRGQIAAGEFTISVAEATLDRWGPDESAAVNHLYLDLRIRCGWRSEYMEPSWSLTRVTDSAGNEYRFGYTEDDGPWFGIFSEAGSCHRLAPFGQKWLVGLCCTPEDMEWVELTFGHGELARTLHVELKEAEL